MSIECFSHGGEMGWGKLTVSELVFASQLWASCSAIGVKDTFDPEWRRNFETGSVIGRLTLVRSRISSCLLP
jgi:hypothetical protein